MISLHINGKAHSIDADPTMPLLWAIRDFVGYTGTKYGCGKGLCGSCMVLIDGEAVNSCQMQVSSVADKKIITIEGKTENLQILQQAWADLNVPQCGYCQPGQLITATALLNKNEAPTDTEINNAMTRNICRCGTYQRIKNAINHSVELKKRES
ncbi:MAG: (2Fe-2S)-binding protein [Flavobacteriaceae bacterium]|nr:MAG: (2Fe-2S)-binding protein [Flavobacteriaceae bacterium]